MADTNDGWKEAAPSDTWKPEGKGDEIVGLLVDVQENVGSNSSMLYTIQVGEERKNVWGSVVLDSRMRGVKVGEEVKIIYQGLGEKKGGNNAPKLFTVFHREPVEDLPF